MKKMLYSLIVIVFFTQDSFSQDYTFDNFYEYKGGNSTLTNFYLLNSKDDSYYLNSANGSKLIYCKLRDTKRNAIHDYEVLNQENSIRFNYQYSRKFYRDTYGSNFVVETSETKIDSAKREIKIIVFKNKRKKTIECEMIIQVEDSQEPFCNQLLNAFCHGRLTNTNFKIDKGILSNFKVVFQNDSKGEMKLVKKGKVDISLSLSKEQLKYLDN